MFETFSAIFREWTSYLPFDTQPPKSVEINIGSKRGSPYERMEGPKIIVVSHSPRVVELVYMVVVHNQAPQMILNDK